MTLPPMFVERLAALVPPERLDHVLASFASPKPIMARTNPLRGSHEAARAALAATGALVTETTIAPGTWRIDLPDGLDRRTVTDSEPVRAGLVHLQNPSSWLPVLALDVEPDDQVLDLCAAPGGKTLHLASLLGPSGYLAAVEPVKPRFFKMKGVLERGGALGPSGASTRPDLRLFMKDGRSVGGAVPERFDKILVDAPCSSEARFDALDPTTFAHWSPKKIAECAHKQRALLRSGLAALKSGGTLVYCTCSFAPEENEDVVTAVLNELDGAVMPMPLSINLTFGPAAATGPVIVPGRGDLALAARVLPDEVWDGFFLIRLGKR